MKFVIYKKLVRENTQLYGTEKAIQLSYYEYEYGKRKFKGFPGVFNDGSWDLWVARSLIKTWEASDGSDKYLYLQIPYWVLTSKRISPSWICDFDNFEIIEEKKETK